METHVHVPVGDITPGRFGDDSYYAVCSCGEKISLFGAYDDDRGVVHEKVWKVQK